MDDAPRRCKLAEQGARWARESTWEKTAEATLKVINQITFLGADLGTADLGIAGLGNKDPIQSSGSAEGLGESEDCD